MTTHCHKIPDASKYVGDRSNTYALLRKEIDEYFEDSAKLEEELKDVRKFKRDFKSYDGANYDTYNCPDKPPIGYPFTWKTTAIVEKWPADDIDPPSFIENDGNQVFLHHNSLCIFDYQRDSYKAIAYREARLPFIVDNDPAVLKTVARWNSPNYMNRLLGDLPHRTELSLTNNFLFHAPPRHPKSSKLRTMKETEGSHRPTKLVRMTFAN
jgi:hypothetical protein